MLRRLSLATFLTATAAGTTNTTHTPIAHTNALLHAQRGIFADKVRAGMVIKVDKRFYRVLANTRSQKGQTAASFNIKLTEVGTGRKKEVTAGQGHDFEEVRAHRVRLLFSGFDDDDFACFVFPEHSAEAGREVNIKGDSLSEVQQQFLACGMPVDILHIPADDESPDTKRHLVRGDVTEQLCLHCREDQLEGVVQDGDVGGVRWERECE